MKHNFNCLLDETTADAALKNLNGLVINNKPIVVQFGKRKLNS